MPWVRILYTTSILLTVAIRAVILYGNVRQEIDKTKRRRYGTNTKTHHNSRLGNIFRQRVQPAQAGDFNQRVHKRQTFQAPWRRDTVIEGEAVEVVYEGPDREEIKFD